MLQFAISLYRTIPVRPHCNAETRTHTLLCRIMRPVIGPECDFPSPP